MYSTKSICVHEAGSTSLQGYPGLVGADSAEGVHELGQHKQHGETEGGHTWRLCTNSCEPGHASISCVERGGGRGGGDGVPKEIVNQSTASTVRNIKAGHLSTISRTI